MPKKPKQPKEPTPFERFALLTKRLIRVPKSEIPREEWLKARPKSEVNKDDSTSES